jgi:hypothetical protein
MPAVAKAQSGPSVAIGASFSVKQNLGPGAPRTLGPSPIWRIGKAKEGWGLKYGLNWFSTDLDGSVAGQQIPLGRLNVRPVMGGYGYTHVMGRTKVSANLLAGYAFTSFSLETAAENAYRSRHAGTPDTSASNVFVVKPEVSTWFDLTPRFGLNVNVGYMMARPEIAIRTLGGEERRRIRADTLMFKVGMAYSFF